MKLNHEEAMEIAKRLMQVEDAMPVKRKDFDHLDIQVMTLSLMVFALSALLEQYHQGLTEKAGAAVADAMKDVFDRASKEKREPSDIVRSMLGLGLGEK